MKQTEKYHDDLLLLKNYETLLHNCNSDLGRVVLPNFQPAVEKKIRRTFSLNSFVSTSPSVENDITKILHKKSAELLNLRKIRDEKRIFLEQFNEFCRRQRGILPRCR